MTINTVSAVLDDHNFPTKQTRKLDQIKLTRSLDKSPYHPPRRSQMTLSMISRPVSRLRSIGSSIDS